MTISTATMVHQDGTTKEAKIIVVKAMGMYDYQNIKLQESALKQDII